MRTRANRYAELRGLYNRSSQGPAELVCNLLYRSLPSHTLQLGNVVFSPCSTIVGHTRYSLPKTLNSRILGRFRRSPPLLINRLLTFFLKASLMTHFVQALLPGSDQAVTVKVATREDALKIVAEWLAEGRSSIRILADGRVYMPAELAMTIING